jgi:hypothetical protein
MQGLASMVANRRDRARLQKPNLTTETRREPNGKIRKIEWWSVLVDTDKTRLSVLIHAFAGTGSR